MQQGIAARGRFGKYKFCACPLPAVANSICNLFIWIFLLWSIIFVVVDNIFALQIFACFGQKYMLLHSFGIAHCGKYICSHRFLININFEEVKEILEKRGRFEPNLFLHSLDFPKFIFIYRVFFFTGPPPKKLKYGKPWLGEVTCI